MRKPASMWSLETLGRVRLSRYFYMREFLYSEIGNIHRIPNIPERPDLALERGRAFCTELLDPLEETFGRVAVRSGYRAPGLNRFGNENRLNCARNTYPQECHIWDIEAVPVAGASIVLPWFADQFEAGRDWRDLAARSHRLFRNLVLSKTLRLQPVVAARALEGDIQLYCAARHAFAPRRGAGGKPGPTAGALCRFPEVPRPPPAGQRGIAGSHIMFARRGRGAQMQDIRHAAQGFTAPRRAGG